MSTTWGPHFAVKALQQSQDATLVQVAKEVEEKTLQMVDDAK